MYDYFYHELETLKARTGYNQWEKLNEAKDPAAEIDMLIKFMVDECNKSPFDVVRPEVKQRVVSRAIVEDGDFIGLNAKFVRRALNAWWLSNGDRVIEAMNQKANSVYERIELTPEENEKVNVLLESYKRRLMGESGFNAIPKMQPEEIKREGAEWTSEIDKKAVSVNYQPPPDEYFQTQDKIRRAGSQLYKGRFDLNLKLFKVGEFQIFAESAGEAEKIYSIATGKK